MFIRMICAALFSLMPLGAFAMHPEMSYTATEDISNLDALVNRYSDETCKECHAQIYAEWKESYHSQSVVHSIGGLRNFIVHGVETGWNAEITKEHMMRCMDCHAPQLQDASESLIREVAELIKKTVDAQDEDAKEKLAKLNVNCVICHNTKVSIEKNLKGKPKPGVYYGPTGKSTTWLKKAGFSATRAHGTEKSAVVTSAIFCGQCHGMHTPPDGDIIGCNTLYGSYQDAYRGNGGTETCQDCHMRNKNRGHRFPGAYEEEIVKDGIGVDAQVTGLNSNPGIWIPTVIATVSLTNKAGHRIPDG